MVSRLRIALGVASSLVAVAALTIVFSGTGAAQGNGNGNGPNPLNVAVVNTPLPITGNVAATISGNISANIINPANSPVLIRDVDAQGPKELWQSNGFTLIPDGDGFGTVNFGPLPAGKALVIEHLNVHFIDGFAPGLLFVQNASSLNGPSADFQVLVPQQAIGRFVVDAPRKFYVGPGATFFVQVFRSTLLGSAELSVNLSGYLVKYP